jgi:hypothetical protein
MRIYGSNATTANKPVSVSRRSQSGTFSIRDDEPAATPTSTASLRTVGGIDALIALQGVEDPAERRRRAAGRGRNALDMLDELKIGLLSGVLDSGTLGRLRSAAVGLKDPSGDARLDTVLAEIDLRVEVELAKMGATT